MNHKVLQTILQFDMLKQGDTVIAAVSGGADSVALLDFLCSLVELKLTVRACHLNHCLRGSESDRDEQLVRTMCEQYGIALDVRRVEIRRLAGVRGTSIETTAREERYQFFAELAERWQAKIATAHTLSDTTETVLLNLARGTGITGLCGIPPVRDGWIIRPLLGCTREQIERYCSEHGLCYVIDSTNLADDYTRNYLRHHVLPQLSHVNSDLLGAIERMTGQLRRDADCLQELAEQAAQSCCCEGGYSITKLQKLHPALRSRVIAELLKQNGVERSAERIARIDQMLQSERRQVLQVGRCCYVVVHRGVLLAEHRTRRKTEPIEPHALQKKQLDGLRIALGEGKTIEFSSINCADYEIFENNTELVLKNLIDYDKIKNDIFLRSRQSGDRIRPAGRGCSKPLRKLFSELALPNREQLCILADSEGIIFAEGVGADERVCADRLTKRLLIVTITRQEDKT
ncbi:MAG: tRNA lysidine(34) synthetase TilS [Anaerotruncus sp.]|nr:tRNA lysidine(34) synthetase TilS [Anaerotruncus sp.]